MEYGSGATWSPDGTHVAIGGIGVVDRLGRVVLPGVTDASAARIWDLSGREGRRLCFEGQFLGWSDDGGLFVTGAERPTSP